MNARRKKVRSRKAGFVKLRNIYFFSFFSLLLLPELVPLLLLATLRTLVDRELPELLDEDEDEEFGFPEEIDGDLTGALDEEEEEDLSPAEDEEDDEEDEEEEEKEV